MPRTLDYFIDASARPKFPSKKYGAILLANVSCLILSLFLLPYEVDGCIDAPFFGVLFGIPLVLLHLACGGVPAWVFFSGQEYQGNEVRIWFLFALSVAGSVIPLAGIVLSWILPTTHGSII